MPEDVSANSLYFTNDLLDSSNFGKKPSIAELLESDNNLQPQSFLSEIALRNSKQL